jgi:S1/P1 Nuclease
MFSRRAHTSFFGRFRISVLPWLLLFSLITPPEAGAWGNSGHEAVAYVAWQHLTPATKTRVMALLKLVPAINGSIPGYAAWVAALPSGLSADQKNLYLFMRAATWADSIKHAGLHDSDTVPEGVTDANEVNIGFTDTASHGYWHFIDQAFASDDETVPDTPAPNVASRIVALRTAIGSSEDDLLKAYDLIFLEHLVGDVHQPLHGTVRYNAGKGDEGGNTVKIKMAVALEKDFGGSKTSPRELHAFWDDLPGVGQAAPALPGAATFAKALTFPSGAAIDNTDPADWANESLALAKSDAYKTPIGPSAASTYTVTPAYYNQALQDAKTRVALAGARLAKLLNDNLQ